VHPEMANVSKKEIKEKLAKVLKVKEETITVFGLKTKFGGGRSSGFALVYDSLDAKKKYDSKPALLRVSIWT
jgi:small subunit ribosomal protein S24e